MLLRTAIVRASTPRLRPRAALGLDGTQDFLRRDRQLIDADADGVENGVGHRRQHWIGAHFSGPLGAERSVGGRTLQNRDVVRADVAGPGHQIFDEIARSVTGIGIVGLWRFVERVADTHPGTTYELLFNQPRIERSPKL